jgi:hypothetical protein
VSHTPRGNPPELRRGCVAAVTTAVLVLSASSLAAPLAAQAPPALVDSLLEHSEVESMLSGVRPGVQAALEAILDVPLPSAVAASLDDQLAVATLRERMVTEFAMWGDRRDFESALALMASPAMARLDSLVEAAPASESIEEFARGLQADPPAPARVRVVARLAAAQRAGDFFVLIDERMREAAYLIASAVMSDAPPFEPIDEAAWNDAARQNLMGVLISFLYRYRLADDSLLEEVASAWESEAGQWYVESYSYSLGETIKQSAGAVGGES